MISDELAVWMKRVEREIEKLKVFEVPKALVWKPYTPTFGGFSVNPTYTAKYFLVAKLCVVDIFMSAAGTSNATTFTVTAPFASATIAGKYWGTVWWTGIDNGAVLAVPGRVIIQSASNVMTVMKDMALGAWTNANGKLADFTLIYEVP